MVFYATFNNNEYFSYIMLVVFYSWRKSLISIAGIKDAINKGPVEYWQTIYFYCTFAEINLGWPTFKIIFDTPHSILNSCHYYK